MAWLEGKKTYILTGLGIVYVGGGLLGWWTIDWHVADILGFGSLMALRAAL